MSDALSVAEIEVQQVELLPARTVLSVFSDGGWAGDGWGGDGGNGGDATIISRDNNSLVQVNIAIGGVGGWGGSGFGGYGFGDDIESGDGNGGYDYDYKY